jgi:drug/metabolite transporter (DMT)-like permease
MWLRIRFARRGRACLTAAVFASRSSSAIAVSLVVAVFLWGANNVGVKHLAGAWPLVWIGCSRMICVGLILLALLRWARWFGAPAALGPETRRALWWRGGLSLAVYVIVFTLALRLTSASHVAVYLATAPVWALLAEGRPRWNRDALKRYGAAALTLAGVAVLFWPKLQNSSGRWQGDLLAVLASVVWTVYSRACRALGGRLSGAELTAHTMWRAAVLLAPAALWEIGTLGVTWRTDLVLVQIYCVVAGGVIAFALWNNALRHWPTSRVFLMGNLIPLSTMAWAYVFLDEPVTATFWPAMALVAGGVVLGQTNWERITGRRWLPAE